MAIISPTKKAISKRDKQNAAIHEAAHVTLAIVLGGDHVRCWITEREVDSEDECSWTGGVELDLSQFSLECAAILAISTNFDATVVGDGDDWRVEWLPMNRSGKRYRRSRKGPKNVDDYRRSFSFLRPSK